MGCISKYAYAHTFNHSFPHHLPIFISIFIPCTCLQHLWVQLQFKIQTLLARIHIYISSHDLHLSNTAYLYWHFHCPHLPCCHRLTSPCHVPRHWALSRGESRYTWYSPIHKITVQLTLYSPWSYLKP